MCKRHREETTIIPNGRAHGWPLANEIDWAGLPRHAVSCPIVSSSLTAFLDVDV